MNLSEIQTEIRKDIDDDIDLGDINGWVNRALDDLSMYANYEKTATISLLADIKEYTYPTDLIKPIMLVDETATPSVEYYAVPFRDLYSTGFKFINNKIRIQPTPDAAKTLTLYYNAALPKLSLPTDTPVIRSDFHDLLVLYAVAKAKYKDEEESLQNNAMAEYLTRREAFAYASASLNTGSFLPYGY